MFLLVSNIFSVVNIFIIYTEKAITLTYWKVKGQVIENETITSTGLTNEILFAGVMMLV